MQALGTAALFVCLNCSDVGVLPLMSSRGPVTSWFLPQAVEAWATDILTVRQADNRIVHHQQRVHNIPVGPWPLRCYLGVTTSLFMMHVLGW